MGRSLRRQVVEMDWKGVGQDLEVDRKVLLQALEVNRKVGGGRLSKLTS